MDRWPLLWVRLGLPQHLVGDGSRIPFPEQQKAEQVDDRVALCPAKVAVGCLAGRVPDVEQEGRYRVGYHRALRAQHLVPAYLHAPYLEHVLELRSVLDLYLQEQNLLLLRDVVVLALLPLLPRVLLLGAVAAAVDDQVDVLARFFYVPLRRLVHLYALLAQFGGALNSRHQRNGDDRGYGDEGDHYPHGLGDDVRHRRIECHHRHQPEAERCRTRCPTTHGEGDGYRRRGHHCEDTRGVGRGLGGRAGLEEEDDGQGYCRVDEDQRPHGPAPFGGHAVAGQVAGHYVQEASHRTRACKPQYGDGGEIVGGAEGVAQAGVCQVGKGPSVRLSAWLEPLVGDKQGRDEARGDQIEAHDDRAGSKHLAGVADTTLGAQGIVVFVAAHQGHHRDSRLETREPERKLRENEHGDAEDCQRAGVVGEQRARPVAEGGRIRRDLVEAHDHDDQVQEHVRTHQEDRYADGLPKAFEEHPTQDRDQH